MIFWTTAALLTLGACLAVLVPVLRGGRAKGDEAAYDVEVYRDQLGELERDLERGVIEADEAQQARAEIGRRIIRAADAEGVGRAGSGVAARWVLTAAVLLVPLGSWATYAVTGSPELPAQPLHARLDRDPSQASVEELVARAERHLAANPGDGRGWDVVAPIYHRMGRHGDAANAYRNAIRLVGATAAREIGLGEALAAEAGGVIGTEAQAAFERALAIEPPNPRARFLVASALYQDGKTEQSAAMLEAMLKDTPPDSPWRDVVEQSLASLSASGPTAEDVEAAQSMAPAEQTAMIEGMVASLDARLRDNPFDVDGWQRLVHSYVAMDRADAAADALARGVEALGPDSAGARQLIAFAASRGVPAVE